MTAVHDNARNGGTGKGMASAGALQWVAYALKELAGYGLAIAASAYVLSGVAVPAYQKQLLEPYGKAVTKQVIQSALVLAQIRVGIFSLVVLAIIGYFLVGRKPSYSVEELLLCCTLGVGGFLILSLIAFGTSLPPIP